MYMYIWTRECVIYVNFFGRVHVASRTILFRIFCMGPEDTTYSALQMFLDNM